MMKFNSPIFTSTLVIIIIGLLGYIALYRTPATESGPRAVTITDTPAGTSESSSQSSAASRSSDSTDSAQTTESSDSASVSSCAATMKQKAQTSGTSYDKGTILVAFKPEVSFEVAQRTLATYGASIKNTTSAKASYPDYRLITASVPHGEEFSKICMIGRDASVRYVNLNTIFDLHE